MLFELQAPPNEATRKAARWLLPNLVPVPGEVSPPGPSALAVRFLNSAYSTTARSTPTTISQGAPRKLKLCQVTSITYEDGTRVDLGSRAVKDAPPALRGRG